MSRVMWIHPSVRDLTIKSLIENERQRRRFLEHCGLPGLELALSSGGGSEGDLYFPLLDIPEDWEVLGQRCQELVTSGDYGIGRVLILAVSTALQFAKENKLEEESYCQGILYDTLCAFATSISTESPPIPVRFIEVFYSATLLVEPLVGSPDLRSTWKKRIDNLLVPSEKAPVSESLLRLWLIWSDLLRVLRKHDPRWLTIFGFPNRYLELIRELMVSLGEFLEALDVLEVEQVDEYDPEEPPEPDGSELEEEEVLQSILSLLDGLAAVIPGSEVAFDELRDQSDPLLECRVQRHEIWEAWEAMNEPDYSEDHIWSGSGSFDVFSIFTDL